MSEFIVDGNYKGYTYIGHAYGRFKGREGDMLDFANIFVISCDGSANREDYKASGFKAEKFKCISADVFTGLTPGDKVKLFFDNKQRVIQAAID